MGGDLCDRALARGASLAGSGWRVLLGTDTRGTGPVIRTLLSAGIIGTGEEVLDTGIVPTPVIVYGLVCAQAREILIAPGAESPTDGIHNEDESGWCRIRASGTKPKIRCTAEGTDLTHAKAMLRAGRDLIRTWKSA
jgi:phosphomannomutase